MEATVNMHRAKSSLSQLVKLAESGEDVIIARNGKPVARPNCRGAFCTVLSPTTSMRRSKK